MNVVYWWSQMQEWDLNTTKTCRCGRQLYDWRWVSPARLQRLCRGCQRLSRYCDCRAIRSVLR